jgi:phosphoglycerate kinase
MHTLDDFDFSGKRVLVRLDLNAPVKNGKVQDCLRIQKSCETLKELIKKKAKVVVIAHQGRKGDEDYTESMKEHAKILSQHLGKNVKYVDDLYGPEAKKAIEKLREGSILLLKNVRSVDEEAKEKTPVEHANGDLVRELYPLFDYYVNDAFSAAHRSHASLVGFTVYLPSAMGRLMQKELESLKKLEKPKHPNILILGGEKPDEVLDMMNTLAPKKEVDKILIGGIIGELFIMASGIKLGKKGTWLKRKKFTERFDEVKKLLDKYGKKIVFPKDLAFKVRTKRVEKSLKDLPFDEMSYDIGKKTIEEYVKIIKKAKTITMKGPMGAYENEGFEKGTKEILRAIKASKGFSLLAGGHTSSLVQEFGFKEKDFSHVSIAGGALVRYLIGKKLPVLEALEKG